MTSSILLDVQGQIAYITLNRPEKRNAINDDVRDGLERHLATIDADDSISVVVIRGAGSCFSAGYDMTSIPGAKGYGPSSRANGGRPSIAQDRERLRKSIERWGTLWNFRKPTIAQVHGYCLAGGGELAAMCDLTYCAEDASFGHPAGRAIGIPMTLALWPMRLGAMRSKELLFTGDLVSGIEAVRVGLANKCFPSDQLETQVRAIAERIAMVPLDALSLHKHVVNRWFEIMGIRTCMSEGAEFNSIFHEFDSAKQFAEVARTGGLKAALDWRDSKFAKK